MPEPDSPLRQGNHHEHDGVDHVLSLLRRLRLDWLLSHFPPRIVRSLYVFVNGFVTIGLLALLAFVTEIHLCFHRLDPPRTLLFFSPLAKASSPRNTILGHAIGLVCGYGAFVLTGAGSIPFGTHPGIFWPRILAAALSLSATGAFMTLLDVSHPPAGATTLIVSLGIIARPRELIVIEVAVFLLVASGSIDQPACRVTLPILESRGLTHSHR